MLSGLGTIRLFIFSFEMTSLLYSLYVLTHIRKQIHGCNNIAPYNGPQFHQARHSQQDSPHVFLDVCMGRLVGELFCITFFFCFLDQFIVMSKFSCFILVFLLLQYLVCYANLIIFAKYLFYFAHTEYDSKDVFKFVQTFHYFVRQKGDFGELKKKSQMPGGIEIQLIESITGMVIEKSSCYTIICFIGTFIPVILLNDFLRVQTHFFDVFR